MSDSRNHELTDELRALRETQVDAIAVRRVRARLMRWAAPEAPRQRFGILPAVSAAAFVAVIAIGTLLVATRRGSSPGDVAPRLAEPAASSVASVVADNASWRSTVEDNVENIILDDGTLRLHVKRKPGSKRVIVHVPDGEIEDLGTVFDVVVRDKHTVAVRVDDGRVTIRLASMAPLTLEAGQSWERTEHVAPSRPQPVIPPSVSDEQPKTTRPTAVTPHTPPLRPADTVIDEDAAYLNIIRAQQSADTASAKRNAAIYLEKFPNGFRRDEVRRFIDE